MLLWLLAALMTLVTGAFILWPLLRPANRSTDRAEYDLVIYRDQLAEVDRDLARGVLSDEQAEAARTEIKRRILAADAERAKQGDRNSRPAFIGAGAVSAASFRRRRISSRPAANRKMTAGLAQSRIVLVCTGGVSRT
jgi:cytochrome c-type biogenesis protein CcmH